MDDTEYQKQIIDTFINAIYVFDDNLVFTYNFKDGTEAIPLKAIEDAFGSDLTQAAPPNQVRTMSLDLFLFHPKPTTGKHRIQYPWIHLHRLC